MSLLTHTHDFPGLFAGLLHPAGARVHHVLGRLKRIWAAYEAAAVGGVRVCPQVAEAHKDNMLATVFVKDMFVALAAVAFAHVPKQVFRVKINMLCVCGE